MFQKFQLWLKTDPKAKAKLIFIAVSSLVIILIFTIFVRLNTGGFKANNTPPANQNQAGSSSTSSLSLLFDQQKLPLKPQDIKDSNNLKPLDGRPTGMPGQVVFLPDSKLLFLDSELQARVNGKTLAQSPTLMPNSIQVAGDITIFNEAESTILLDLKSSKFSLLNSDIRELTPWDSNFLFLTVVGRSVFIKQSQSIALKNTQILGSFTPGISAQAFEIKVFNDNPYVFVYSSSDKTGQVEVWTIYDKKPKKIQTLENVQSLLFGKKNMVYTYLLDDPTVASEVGNRMLTFNQDVVQSVELEISKNVSLQQLYGEAIAHRCTFDESEENLLCLIKQKKTLATDEETRDVIVQFNIQDQSATYPFIQTVFSASYIYSANQKIYIVGQLDDIIYEITQEK